MSVCKMHVKTHTHTKPQTGITRKKKQKKKKKRRRAGRRKGGRER